MKTVAVLMGGWSAEREVSLSSGRGCAAALREGGYSVLEVDVTRDLDALIAALMPRPDVAFNALHGRGGEDGTIQGLLEILRLPYTHSGVTASALAMDKPLAKQIFAQAGLPVVEGRVLKREELLAGDPMPAPYVVKPPNEGSSVGVVIVRERDNHPPLSAQTWPFPGREVHPRPRDHRRRHGRSCPGRFGDPDQRHLLRLHRQVFRRRLGSHHAGADPPGGL
jgi:D-alanine-D-alanine ligase